MKKEEIDVKVCRDCQVAKPLDEFSPDKKSSLGRRPECKVCRRENYALKRAGKSRVSVAKKPQIAEVTPQLKPKASKTSVKKKSTEAKPKVLQKRSALEFEPEVPAVKEVKIIEKIVKVEVEKPATEAEIQRRVDERFKLEVTKRKKQKMEQTIEKRAQTRAIKKLIDHHAAEYKRTYDRELIALKHAEGGWDAMFSSSSQIA